MSEAVPNGAVLVICLRSLKFDWAQIGQVDPAASLKVIGVTGYEADAPRWIIVNYDLLARNAKRLHAIAWSGVVIDEAHFIKNASQRRSQVLKIIGVSDNRREAPSGPAMVFLLTGTPMPNRPRDLWGANS